MTNWDLIHEHVKKTMESVEQSHNVSKKLQSDATPENFDQFKMEMKKLTEHLTNLQTVLDHQDTYAIDELAEWLSKTFGGQYKEYRHTPHLSHEK